MAWLTTGGERGGGITYDAARRRMLSEFGVKTSDTALSHFYHRYHKAAQEVAGVADTPTCKGCTITINLRLRSAACAAPFFPSATHPAKN